MNWSLMGGEGVDFNFNRDQLRREIAAVAKHNRDSEFPDVIGLADLVALSARVAADLTRRVNRTPGSLLTLQYPNFTPASPKKMRDFAILQPADEVMFRTLAGRLVERADGLLTEAVRSFRLDPPSKFLPWNFRDSRASHRDFVNRAFEVLDRGRYRVMYRTDIARYFPSIDLALLERALVRCSLDAGAVRATMEMLYYWQRPFNLNGIPIGPEASTVLGNFFLHSVDLAIANAGGVHLRYMDDYLLFAETPVIADALIGLVAEQLSRLELQVSDSKTDRFFDPEKAKASLRKGWLTSLGSYLKRDRPGGVRALHYAFDQITSSAPEDLDKSEVTYVMGALTNKKDSYGCVLLSRNPCLVNLDLKLSANYLALGLSDHQSRSALVDAIMEQLGQSPSERSHARDLHLLRTLTKARTGETEGKKCLSIATDPSRPWPVRNFAWHAYAQSAPCRETHLMEAAWDEADPNVRRAIIAALPRVGLGRRRRRTFLRDAGRRFPGCAYVAEWVRAA